MLRFQKLLKSISHNRYFIYPLDIEYYPPYMHLEWANVSAWIINSTKGISHEWICQRARGYAFIFVLNCFGYCTLARKKSSTLLCFNLCVRLDEMALYNNIHCINWKMSKNPFGFVLHAFNSSHLSIRCQRKSIKFVRICTHL